MICNKCKHSFYFDFLKYGLQSFILSNMTFAALVAVAAVVMNARKNCFSHKLENYKSTYSSMYSCLHLIQACHHFMEMFLMLLFWIPPTKVVFLT